MKKLLATLWQQDMALFLALYAIVSFAANFALYDLTSLNVEMGIADYLAGMGVGLSAMLIMTKIFAAVFSTVVLYLVSKLVFLIFVRVYAYSFSRSGLVSVELPFNSTILTKFIFLVFIFINLLLALVRIPYFFSPNAYYLIEYIVRPLVLAIGWFGGFALMKKYMLIPRIVPNAYAAVMLPFLILFIVMV